MKNQNKISLRESTQFPPSHEGNGPNTCYKRTYLDSTGVTNNGLVQVLNLQTKKVVSQYLKVGNHRIALTPKTSYEDAFDKLKGLLTLVQ